MRLRSRVRSSLSAGLVAGLGVWGASAALALSLGEPRLLSEPGQPLIAEVPLRDAGRTVPDQIQIRWPSEPAWVATGLRPLAREQFELRIEQRPQGPVLRIESLVPWRTQTLDLLLELQWPKGRLLRELSLWLGSSADPNKAEINLPSVLLVLPGDTAGALALSNLDPQGTLAQSLIALAQANPEAFIDGNVNRLRAGVVLKLPDAGQIRAIDPQEAQQRVAQQVEAFALYRAQIAAQAGPPADDSSQVASGKVQPSQREPVPSPGDRLTLSAPGADDTDRIAEQKQAQQTAERAAEINRNIQDLNRLIQSDSAPGLQAPLPEPLPAQGSKRIEQWVQSPYTPWAALGLVLTLALWVAVRRRHATSDAPAQTPVPVPDAAPPLAVDFDLNLPSADQLPPLPDQVHAPPTPVRRSQVTSPSGPAEATAVRDPMAGLSLDLPATELPLDPHEQRLALAEALWAQGLSNTARVLARDVMTQAPLPWSDRAREWLNERA